MSEDSGASSFLGHFKNDELGRYVPPCHKQYFLQLRLDKFLTSARYFFKISCDNLRHVIVLDSFSPIGWVGGRE
jgi:hypothetical protein